MTLHQLMSGSLNGLVHRQIYGGSLIENPERYLSLSPDLHLSEVRMPFLFEAGAESGALLMMGYPKAANAAGNGSEFVIYPRTGHSISNDVTRREAAQRNLDWFRFWLQDYEDADPAKRSQYERWRALRDFQCARQDGLPAFCQRN